MSVDLETKLRIRLLAERVFDISPQTGQKDIAMRMMRWCKGDQERAQVLLVSADSIPRDVRIPIAQLLAKADTYATYAEELEEEEAPVEEPVAPPAPPKTPRAKKEIDRSSPIDQSA